MGINYTAIIATLGLTATIAVIVIATQNGPGVTVEIDKSLPASCSNGQDKHADVTNSSSPILQKLAEYEEVCKGAVTNQMMTFAPMPTSLVEARDFARTTATELKEFARHDISPLVVFEPSLEQKDIVKQIRSGQHDLNLKEYYSTLKQEGVTDASMGTWVLFPEANTPTWDTTDPEDFTMNVTKVAQFQKAIFPKSKVTILLNSSTYPDHDISWAKGERKDLAPYLKNLPKTLIDSFGYQGFPYAPPASSTEKPQLKANEFLDSTIAIEAAKTLGTNSIWLNTGTFKTMHASKPGEQVTLSKEQREAILKDVLKQVQNMQTQNLNVSVNLFSEDKTHVDEGVDWSYWKHGQQAKSPDAAVFDMFARRLRAANADFSLYDSAR